MIYLSSAIGLTPGGTFTHKQYTERHKRNNTYIEQHNSLGECGPCHVLASYTLAFIDPIPPILRANTTVVCYKGISVTSHSPCRHGNNPVADGSCAGGHVGPGLCAP